MWKTETLCEAFLFYLFLRRDGTKESCGNEGGRRRVHNNKACLYHEQRYLRTKIKLPIFDQGLFVYDVTQFLTTHPPFTDLLV